MNNISFSLLLSLIANLTFNLVYACSRSYLGLSLDAQIIIETNCLYYFLSTLILLVIHSDKISKNNGALLAISILFIPYLGLITPSLIRAVIDVLGFFSFFYTLYSGIKVAKLNIILLFFLFFLSYTLWTNSYFSSWTGVFSPIISMELAELGILHKDIFYMSSMVSMIKNYDIVSTGIHGLVKNQIHFLPLYWHAAASKTFHTPPISSLCTNAFLVLTPLFFVVFLSVLKIKNKLSDYQTLFAAGALILLDAAVNFTFIVNYDFVFSLIIFSLALLFLSEEKNLKNINYFSLITTIIISVLLFKIKPHTALFVFSIYALSFFNSLKKYPYKLFIVAITAIVAVILLLPSDSIYLKYVSTFRPFSFNIVYPEISFYFLFVLLSIALLFRDKNSKNDFLILSHLFLFVISFNVLRGIPDGNSHYYTYCLFLLSIFLTFKSENFFIIDKYKKLAATIFILSCAALSYRSIASINEYNKTLINEAKNTQTQSDILAIKKSLNSIDTKDAFIYVEPNQKRIWNLVRECSSKAFLFSAYFEVPRLYGAPPTGFCPLYKAGYGYDAYINAKSINLSKEEMCNYSKQYNLNKIIILRFDNNVEIENIVCTL